MRCCETHKNYEPHVGDASNSTRKDKKEKSRAVLQRYLVPLWSVIFSLSLSSSHSDYGKFMNFTLLNFHFSLTFSGSGCPRGCCKSLRQDSDCKTWLLTDLLPNYIVDSSALILENLSKVVCSKFKLTYTLFNEPVRSSRVQHCGKFAICSKFFSTQGKHYLKVNWYLCKGTNQFRETRL